MFKLKNIFTLLFLFLAYVLYAQYDVPDKPNFIPPVIDSTQTLSKKEYQFLYEKLKNYNDTTSTEVIIVIIPTTKGENIGLLAPRWGQKWGIGQAKEDNGVFILLAKNDRNIWISPGYGLEHKLTAGITGELIRNIIIPEFKQNDYFSGLNKGTDAIFQILNGEYQAVPKSTTDGGTIPTGFFVILFFIFIIILISISKNRRGGGNGGNRRNRSDGMDILEAIILSNLGRGSYKRGSSGGFGGSSGGFGGFGGGGGFSGGGAGGSW